MNVERRREIEYVVAYMHDAAPSSAAGISTRCDIRSVQVRARRHLPRRKDCGTSVIRNLGGVLEGRERVERCGTSSRVVLLRAPEVDFHAGDELPEPLITAVDVHQFDWRACVDGLVQADTPSDDDEA